MVKFRALTVKNSGREFNEVWVEGDLIHSKGKTYIHPISNAVTVKGEIGRLIIMHEVNPETVRQVKTRRINDLEEQKVKSKGTFLIPVQVGGFIWDKYDPNTPKVVIGYRIGRMMGEDEEDYEEDFPSLEWYIQYGNGGTECSVPISEIGVSIFLSQKEAMAATQYN